MLFQSRPPPVGRHLFLPALRADHREAVSHRDGVQEPQEDGCGRTLR